MNGAACEARPLLRRVAMRLTASRASDVPSVELPTDRGFDATLDLLAEGYLFITNRCRQLGSDVFATRLALKKVVCMQGEEAARVFYDGSHFTRKGAMPPFVLRLLQDVGSVQTLDGPAHRHRKQMFMGLMSEGSVRELGDAVDEAWRERADAWRRRSPSEDIVLHDEVREILCRAVCAWAGIPIAESEVEARTRELAAMIEGAGTSGVRAARGLYLRRRTERWARRMIIGARSNALRTRPGCPLDVVAHQRDERGRLLDPEIAAVELLNLVRPTVAVARFVVFAALALKDNPDMRAALVDADDANVEAFAQEVRRFYPFFPAVGGRVKVPFDFRGHHFELGDWVLFDLYGTNHDPRIWGDPEVFRPERFFEQDVSSWSFVPQGGGEYLKDHRCPGEAFTVEIIRRAVRWLARGAYHVPAQDLSIDTSRIPALPASGFVIRGVEW